MIQEVKFTCTALQGTGRQGRLAPDENGYYTLPIGGLDCFNSANEYYPYQAARNLFEQSSSFMRRTKTACLKGEYGHPKRQVGESDEMFAARVMRIEEKSVSHHFGEIWLDLNSVKDDKGRPIVAIMAKVKPAGPYGAALKESLDNEKEDTCFSIRAFTEDVRRGGVKLRNLVDIVTWDHVVEPGINIARKYKAPALEAHLDTSFTRQTLEQAVKQQDSFALESAVRQTQSLFEALGWDLSHLSRPKFLDWK